MDTIKGLNTLTGSLQTKEPIVREQEQTEDSSTGGIIILPPIAGDTNAELDSYPQDYIEYSMQRMEQYKKEHGELPAWEHTELTPENS